MLRKVFMNMQPFVLLKILRILDAYVIENKQTGYERSRFKYAWY